MCSFIYGQALEVPILGKYFEFPKEYPPNHNLIFDRNTRKITDVSPLVNHLFAMLYSFNYFLKFRYLRTAIWKQKSTRLKKSKCTKI